MIACLALLLTNRTGGREGGRLGAVLATGLGVGDICMLAIFGVANPGRYVWPTVALAYVPILAMLASADGPTQAIEG